MYKFYQIPFSGAVLIQIQNIIRSKEIVVFSDKSIDRYEAMLFRQQQIDFGTKSIALFDQNVLNDIVGLVRATLANDVRPCNERGRLGAALMAFLQVADILIEPSLAIHEKGSNALLDLQLFRCADNVDSRVFAKIAIGELDGIPASALPHLQPLEIRHDFSKKIKGRAIFRIALLKIASLELSSLTPINKMEAFLRWSFEEFCLARIPILLACAYLSPNRKSPMIKSLASPDRKRALEGIENALWDVQLIDNWTRRVSKQKEENKICLLCTRDKAVRNIAEMICQADASPSDVESIVLNYFIEHWGENNGRNLAAALADYELRTDHPNRLLNQDRSTARLSKMDAALQKEIIAWHP